MTLLYLSLRFNSEEMKVQLKCERHRSMAECHFGNCNLPAEYPGNGCFENTNWNNPDFRPCVSVSHRKICVSLNGNYDHACRVYRLQICIIPSLMGWLRFKRRCLDHVGKCVTAVERGMIQIILGKRVMDPKTKKFWILVDQRENVNGCQRPPFSHNVPFGN